ncbi:histidine ammonia-lyase [Haladaptatus pallidirubidus]|uniref:Histidine ammonia-lyase n=1 Tax=Haladaptatus pallidirubidus TaxID=1008152 RepID=A0AAV3URS6_9EURY|nr:aromatic amino acid ammonia-lyase [Haladaptatus pallidirubidus]
MIELDGTLTIADVIAVARNNEPVRVTSDAVTTMQASRDAVKEIVDSDERHVYGVNTGLGDLQNVSVSREQLRQMQQNIIESHAASVGDPASTEVVRAAMLVRANALAIGVSGVRPALVEQYCALLNAGVHPQVPLGGSSDDLAAAAHIALVLTGKGEAEVAGEIREGSTALKTVDISPLQFEPKEGLASISGTPIMTAMLALAIHDAATLVRAADVIGALSFSLLGDASETFSERVFSVRAHDPHAISASNIRSLLGESTEQSLRMKQDPLSLRVIPQVHGTVRRHIDFARTVVENELQSASDNPLVFPDGETYSCGAFNGQSIASAADTLSSVLTKLGSISESRTRQLLDGEESDDVASFLTVRPGAESGLMIAQYTAAGLLAESIIDGSISDHSITVSSGQEDIHSMGTIATRTLHQLLTKVQHILAIELLCTIRRAQLTSDPPLSDSLQTVIDYVEQSIDFPREDTQLSDVIDTTADSIMNGDIQTAIAQTDVQLE